MADYIYLLQTRLTPAQQAALSTVRDIARSRALTVFLVGGAVRDLTSGSPIRDLDVVVQGAAQKLRKDIEKAGGLLVGESDTTQSLHFHFMGGVRMEVGSTLAITYPKPGKPVMKAASILDDLRHRDFTANAMAISLNEGSYGLLMDPLNGVADIENRELRLVSNYGFIEDPVRMIRAARLSARLGWHLEERTQARYDTGKQEDYIGALSSWRRASEVEEILREEDPLRVLRRLESEGWMSPLATPLSSTKANEPELDRLRELVGQLHGMGIFPDTSAAYFPLLTAKLTPKDIASVKEGLARPGFLKQIDDLEAETKAFAAQFSAKEASAPSAAYKMLLAAVPEQVLWLAYTSKSPAVQARFKAFLTEWPQARQRVPYGMMQEMRITPDLPGYAELIEQIFFATMDGKMDTPEAAKAFLEPFSPPAPPPPVNLRRRAVKRETKAAKPRSKKAAAVEPDESEEDVVLEPAETSVSAEVDASDNEENTSPEAPLVAPATPPKAAPATQGALKAVQPGKSLAKVSSATKEEATAAKPLPKASAKAVSAPGKGETSTAKTKASAVQQPASARPAAPLKTAAKVVPAPKAGKKAVAAEKAGDVAPKAAGKSVAAKVVAVKKAAARR